MLNSDDWASIYLSMKLAFTSTVILLLIAIPLAMWLAFKPSNFKAVISSLVTLPLILPPTVLGFYLLLAMGPHGLVGQICLKLGIPLLPFSFSGLVIASIIYSMPFVVMPIQNTFLAIGKTSLEVAATLGAAPTDRIFSVLLPQAKIGIISAAVVGFAHTVGEFGLILMIGGNIPQKTQVAAIQIYNYFEIYEYSQANHLALFLLGFSFVVLIFVYILNHKLNPLSHN